MQLLGSSCTFYSRKKGLDYIQYGKNRKFERLEPHFQTLATKSAPREDRESAVALTRSRECTKELIPTLPQFGSMGTFGATAEKRNVLRKTKTAADVVPVSLLSGMFSLRFMGSARQVGGCAEERAKAATGAGQSQAIYTPRADRRSSPQCMA